MGKYRDPKFNVASPPSVRAQPVLLGLCVRGQGHGDGKSVEYTDTVLHLLEGQMSRYKT